MKFKAPENESVSIGLTSGHSIVVTPEGSDVPARFRKEALARGCVPVGMDITPDLPNLNEPDARKRQIIEGIEKMLDSDDEDAFTGAGAPDVRKLSAIVGFRVSTEERDAAWAELSPHAGGGDGEE